MKKWLMRLVLVMSFCLSACSPTTSIQYTVTFDSQGGDSVASMQVVMNTTLLLPEIEKEGYTFQGWYTGFTINDAQFTNVTPVLKDTTLYAKWVVNQYTLQYITGTQVVIPTQTYDYGEVILFPSNPYLSFYAFDGWYLDQYEWLQPFDATTMPAQNTTLYAHYVPDFSQEHTYIVTGEEAGWDADAVFTNPSYRTTLLEPSDARITSLSSYLNDSEFIHALQVTFLDNDSGEDVYFDIGGVVTSYDIHLAFNLICKDMEGTQPLWWWPWGYSGSTFTNLTPETLLFSSDYFMDGGIEYNRHAVVLRPGTYDIVLIVYSHGSYALAALLVDET